MDHTEDCAGVHPGDECAPRHGDWNQPPGDLVAQAEEELEGEADEVPWCQIQSRAWEIAKREEE